MKKEIQNYEDSIVKFLKFYKAKYGFDKTMELMDDIIQKKAINCLPKDLRKAGAERLSEELSRIILRQLKSEDPDKYDVTSLLPSILKNHMTVSNKKVIPHNNVKFVKKTFIKAAILACTTMIVGISKPSTANIGDIAQNKLVSQDLMISPKKLQFVFSNILGSTYKLNKKNYKIADHKVVTPSAVSVPTPTQLPDPTQEPTKVPNIDAASKRNVKLDTNSRKKVVELDENESELDAMLEMNENKDIEEDKKNEVLNDFRKCKTIDSILKRQEELESLGLTNSDKLYKDCKLSAPLQRFIYEQSLAWKLTPPDFSFAIIDTETRGGFGSSGSRTYNKSSNTSDLGLTQQNDYYRVRPFAQAYGISYKKAKNLVQHNDYVNVVCAFLEYQEIASHFDEFNAEEYAGCYNGWLKWRSISSSRNYVRIFQNAYQNKYTKYHKIQSVNTIKKGENKVYIKK
ncbi:MAG: hypothetical protein HFJ12_05710 [Bacilli bacterium]|nr:hypothetical protein [Bacilli bacterium]